MVVKGVSRKKTTKKKPDTHQKKAIRPSTVPAEPKQNQWVGMIRHYIHHPVDFVKDQIGVTPDAWQGDALNAIAQHDRVAVRSGHGVGKTALESWTILWMLLTRPHARVPCTAPGRPQLEDVLWPELAKWLQSSKLASIFRWTKTKVYFNGFEETWFATMRTAAKPENMQGFHGDHMLWILDEASGLEDEITEVIEGSLTGGSDNKILMCGNPTQLSGLFHRAFHREADLWHGMRVSCLDSPRVSQSYIEKMRRFGEDSDIYRVRVLGEFPRGGMDTFLSYGEVQKATYREVPEGSPVELGIDVARFGDDSTVFAVRKGLKLLPLESQGGWDTVQTAERAVELVREHGVSSIKVDDTGVGGGVTDNLRRLKRESKIPRHVQIVPVNNGAKGDEFYDNLGAVAWGHFGDMLPHISLPDDDEELFMQLTDRRKRMTPKGKIALEPKSEMKARGKSSPDRADAAVLAFFDAEVPDVDPVAVSSAFEFSATNLWAPSRWKVV